MLPRIEFRSMPLDDHLMIIRWAYFDDNKNEEVNNLIKNYYGMDNIPDEEIIEVLDEKIIDDYNKNYDLISEYVYKYNIIWSDYREKYFKKIIKYLNTDWDINKIEILAIVGSIPICPRVVDDYMFFMPIRLDDSKEVIKVCARESLRFLWFKKFKELYSDIDTSEYNSDSITWKYSEMVMDIILNSKDIQNLIHSKEKSYDEFYKLKINGKNVMEELNRIYNLNISIEDKIKKGFEYVKELEK